jgi:acetyltransferase-like isoleucine patch superfamily enzyme
MSLGSILHRLIRTHIWGMDIHPSARIEAGALIDRTWPRGIHIGADTYIDHEAVVLSHDFTRNLNTDTRIGARCFLGARAIILPGMTVGDDCVIEPGALVNRDMPPNTIARGNPAQIRDRD